MKNNGSNLHLLSVLIHCENVGVATKDSEEFKKIFKYETGHDLILTKIGESDCIYKASLFELKEE